MDISVVATLYHSEPYLREFHDRAVRAAEAAGMAVEIVLVNDGSPDGSLAVALELLAKDPRVKVVDLSRNFGHHKAMMVGLRHATGDRVFLIDCDLEEAPELLGEFGTEMDRTHADMVYGVQRNRKGGIFERFSGWLFYFLFNLFSGTPIPSNGVTARLMTRRYVDALLQHGEYHAFIDGLWEITGFHQQPLMVDKGNKGSTTYDISRRLFLVVDAVTSFSSRPLVLVFYMGLAIFLLAAAAAVYLVVRHFWFGDLLMGWASVIVSISLLGGMTIFCLGVIGIYMSKMFIETKRRPYAIVRAVHERKRENGALRGD